MHDAGKKNTPRNDQVASVRGLWCSPLLGSTHVHGYRDAAQCPPATRSLTCCATEAVVCNADGMIVKLVGLEGTDMDSGVAVLAYGEAELLVEVAIVQIALPVHAQGVAAHDIVQIGFAMGRAQ